MFRVGGYNKKFFSEIKFCFFPTLQKITVGGFVNQLIKKILALCTATHLNVFPCVFQEVRWVQHLWRGGQEEAAEADLPGVWPLVSSHV